MSHPFGKISPRPGFTNIQATVISDYRSIGIVNADITKTLGERTGREGREWERISVEYILS